MRFTPLVEVVVPLELAEWLTRVDWYCAPNAQEVHNLELIQDAAAEAVSEARKHD